MVRAASATPRGSRHAWPSDLLISVAIQPFFPMTIAVMSKDDADP
jgi:hypothetical protein